MRTFLLSALLLLQQTPASPPRTAQPPATAAGVNVSGHVTMGTRPLGTEILRPLTVVFLGPREGLSIEAPIHADGTFELQNVPPGNYDVRTLPPSSPTVSTKIVVADRNLTGIAIDVPLRAEIRGRVTMADGSSVSSLSLIAAFRSASGSAAVGFDPEGSFSIRLNQASYTVSLAEIPAGYEIRSMISGTTDLLKDPLRVEGANTFEIRMTLARPGR